MIVRAKFNIIYEDQRNEHVALDRCKRSYPLHTVAETIIHNAAECIIISRSWRKGGKRWIGICKYGVSCTISLLFTNHCIHNRGPEAKETTVRHAAFLSVCIVCTARDIAVLSDPTREKCFVAGQTTLFLCR